MDWQQVAGQVAAVYIKATEGVGSVDARFAANWLGAQNYSIPVGAYHFFRTDQDAQAQAEHFLSTVQGGDLDPVLDIEIIHKPIKQSLADAIAAYIQAVGNALQSKRVMIFTGPSFWTGSMGNITDFAGQPLWTAEYTNRPAPRLYGGWTSYRYWQYTDKGRVAGIRGNVDLSRKGDTP